MYIVHCPATYPVQDCVWDDQSKRPVPSAAKKSSERKRSKALFNTAQWFKFQQRMPKYSSWKSFAMLGFGGGRRGPLDTGQRMERTFSPFTRLRGLGAILEAMHHSKKIHVDGAMAEAPKEAAQGPPEEDRRSFEIEGTEPQVQTGNHTAGLNVGPTSDSNLLLHAQVTEALFEQDRIGVAIVGLDGRILRVNRALATLLQSSPKELVGMAFEVLAAEVARGHGAGSTEEGPPGQHRLSEFVSHLRRKSGDTVACLVDSYVISGEDGRASHFLVFVADARSAMDSDQRSWLEDELHQARALQTLGTLAAGVAHDFNNALEVIIGFASLARIRLSSSDPLHEPLKIIEESARGAAELAQQLLDVSKDEPDAKEPVDVEELVRTVVSIISRTFDRKIRIDYRISGQLPCVEGGRNRLVRAVLNLCINARDAMPKGGTLTLTAEPQTINPGDPRLKTGCTPGHYVRIAVRDSGEGMPSEIMEKIFVPHFTTKSAGRGSGLGLALVDRIVKDANGFISVASKPGEGSEFALYLPAAPGERPSTAHRQAGRLMSGRGRVLVVDDEPRVLEFLEKGLTRLGYDVVPAESGRRACEIYSRQSEEISCVLLDLIMPGMSGLEAYARLRDINPRVRVILSSGYSSGGIRQEAAEVGGPEFLAKPYTLEELSQALQKIQQN
jgi:PAS domain S-box-containing protein